MYISHDILNDGFVSTQYPISVVSTLIPEQLQVTSIGSCFVQLPKAMELINNK